MKCVVQVTCEVETKQEGEDLYTAVENLSKDKTNVKVKGDVFTSDHLGMKPE